MLHLAATAIEALLVNIIVAKNNFSVAMEC